MVDSLGSENFATSREASMYQKLKFDHAWAAAILRSSPLHILLENVSLMIVFLL